MKKLLFVGLFFICFYYNFSQSESNNHYKIITIGFYNLENLLDTIDDPDTKDEYSPIIQLKTNKSKAYYKKIDNMASVISKIGKKKKNQSPDILGICEVENDNVINDLIESKYLKDDNYSFINIPSNDWRGIDVALLYKNEVFQVSDFKNYKLKAYNREGFKVKTRDQILVSGYLDNELIHIIVNHWPSQRGGKRKTAYLREKSAELTLNIINELKNEYDNPKIIIMGDFNENPSSKSFKKILKTTTYKKKLNSNNFYNPFEILYKSGYGTLGFRDNLNLFDQILISDNLVVKNNDYKSFKFYKSNIFNPNFLTTKKGKYKGYPYRSWSNGQFTGGYSDHYPVYIYLIKKM